MKRVLLATAATSVLLAGSAMAQSAKFTAAWEDNKVTLDEFNINYTPTGDTSVTATELMGTIHVPSQKELLIGVSGVANIVTFTEAKGRNGGFSSTAEAEGTIDLEVRVVPEGADPMCGTGPADSVAAPGALTLASRKQTLTVTVDLDVVDAGECEAIDGDGTLQEDECLAALLDIEGDVTVALGLDTTAAHHFNFVSPDLSSGTYDVYACFSGDADGMVTEEEAGDNKVHAYVAVMQRMLTVQQVRAVQGDFIEVD